MAPSKLNRIFSVQLSSLSDEEFQFFCVRLLQKLYPSYSSPLTFVNNGYAIIQNEIFSFIPDENSIDSLIKKIAPHIKKPVSKLILLAKTAITDQSQLRNKIKTKLNKINSEIWAPETFTDKAKSFSDSEIKELIGTESTFSKYFNISLDQEVAFSYYQEVATYIVSNFPGPLKPIEFENTDKAFAGILEKVPLNFSSVQTNIWDTYKYTYQLKSFAEKFIQERYKCDPDFKLGLTQAIRSNFCSTAKAPRPNFPVNDVEVINQMAAKCLKAEFKDDPKFINLALGIVLFFFELCIFGARNEQDQKLTLFD